LKDKPDFSAVWANRGAGFTTAFSRVTTSHSAALVAFVSACLGMRPNHLTVLSCLAGVAAFTIAFFLPTGRVVNSVIVLFVVAELVFVIDCADGILARVTNSTTRFGGYFDHTLDVVGQTCALAAIFVFAYRAGLASNNAEFAHAALIIGFLFLLAREARHFAVHLFQEMFSQEPAPLGSSVTMAIAATLLKSLLTYQASMLAVLVYLASPMASLVIYGMQAALLIISVFRHIGRARRLGSSMSADEEH
jgi:phosphatidylglycerophosphate synthase